MGGPKTELLTKRGLIYSPKSQTSSTTYAVRSLLREVRNMWKIRRVGKYEKRLELVEKGRFLMGRHEGRWVSDEKPIPRVPICL